MLRFCRGTSKVTENNTFLVETPKGSVEGGFPSKKQGLELEVFVRCPHAMLPQVWHAGSMAEGSVFHNLVSVS